MNRHRFSDFYAQQNAPPQAPSDHFDPRKHAPGMFSPPTKKSPWPNRLGAILVVTLVAVVFYWDYRKISHLESVIDNQRYQYSSLYFENRDLGNEQRSLKFQLLLKESRVETLQDSLRDMERIATQEKYKALLQAQVSAALPSTVPDYHIRDPNSASQSSEQLRRRIQEATLWNNRRKDLSSELSATR